MLLGSVGQRCHFDSYLDMFQMAWAMYVLSFAGVACTDRGEDVAPSGPAGILQHSPVVVADCVVFMVHGSGSEKDRIIQTVWTCLALINNLFSSLSYDNLQNSGTLLN